MEGVDKLWDDEAGFIDLGKIRVRREKPKYIA